VGGSREVRIWASIAPAVSVKDFNAGNVLHPAVPSWRYAGSLTAPASFTPTCVEAEGSVDDQLKGAQLPENVSWVVLKPTLEMSSEQIRSFSTLFDHNSRETQALNARVVSDFR
jgi:carbonic anhydrase